MRKTFMLPQDCINNQMQHCNICNSSTLAPPVVFATLATLTILATVAKTSSALAAYCTVLQQEQVCNKYCKTIITELIYLIALKDDALLGCSGVLCAGLASPPAEHLHPLPRPPLLLLVHPRIAALAHLRQ
jgi:hypothetical protein